MTAEEIHKLGLAEVERIQQDMRAIMQKVGFEGTLQEFFEHMKEDEQFYYPATAEGKQAYLDETNRVVAEMKDQLDTLFDTQPKAELRVKAVEPFREKTAGVAFYERPAKDGSRPGIYYINLYDMKSLPKYELQALAYHEAIPGHHMQNSIALELQNIPQFRQHMHITAYGEGWGLYAEYLPTELGLYRDPYSNFGRLSMELWRAARLVVDTGLHAKQWTREQAIHYIKENSLLSDVAATKEIERYIVIPAQATAYKIGMLKIIELREKARAALGDEFDVRQYHNLVLKNGAMPLNVLERRVDRWIEESKAA